MLAAAAALTKGCLLGAHRRFRIPWLFATSRVMAGTAMLFGVWSA